MATTLSTRRRLLTPGRAALAVAITALASSLFLVFGVAHSRTSAPPPASTQASAQASAEPASLSPELWHGFELIHLRLH
ncbi:MAG TPA: hypothetical protein PLB41_02005 [Rubrivivax sp.]|nr:hypothetical protein [Rubrivivax sp.]HPO18829.1 hypothetical protein [Rubrivivax sp.]